MLDVWARVTRILRPLLSGMEALGRLTDAAFTAAFNGQSGVAGRKEPTMLVLSRQRDETIIIGDDIEVKIVDIRGDKVRLGITAPPRISVHRKEVYDAIQRENQSAASVSPQDLENIPSGPQKKSRTSGTGSTKKASGPRG